MKRCERSRFVVACLAACSLMACGSDSMSSPDAAPSASPDGGELADTSVAEGGGPVADFCTSKPVVASVTDITGTWVARVTGAIVVNAPIIGMVRQQMVLTLLVDVTQQGTQVVANGRYCNRRQKSQAGSLTQVMIPDAWAHTETPIRRPGTFIMGSDGVPVLSFSTYPEVMGAVLGAPATETLPSTPDDPRNIDQDNDGHPGITVYLTGLALSGQLFSVQRQITAFTAIPVAADRIEGSVTFSTEQNVLASDPSNLASLYAQAGQSGADPTPCTSTIAMVKVPPSADGGAVTCDWVRANETAWFGE